MSGIGIEVTPKLSSPMCSLISLISLDGAIIKAALPEIKSSSFFLESDEKAPGTMRPSLFMEARKERLSMTDREVTAGFPS